MSPKDQKRWAARMVVLCDGRISFGARVLYCYLDDMASYKGFAWPGQHSVADQLGVSVSQIRRLYRELEGRHLATRRACRATATRTLRWAEGLDEIADMRPIRAQKRATGRANMLSQYLIEPVLIEPVPLTEEEKTQNPCDCGGTGYYPVGSSQPCRECELGWSLHPKKKRRA